LCAWSSIRILYLSIRCHILRVLYLSIRILYLSTCILYLSIRILYLLPCLLAAISCTERHTQRKRQRAREREAPPQSRHREALAQCLPPPQRDSAQWWVLTRHTKVSMYIHRWVVARHTKLARHREVYMLLCMLDIERSVRCCVCST